MILYSVPCTVLFTSDFGCGAVPGGVLFSSATKFENKLQGGEVIKEAASNLQL